MGRAAERWRGPRRAVRWRCVVVEDRRPSTRGWDESRTRLRTSVRSREIKRGSLNGDGIEPDHVAVIVGELSVVVIVATGMVRLEVPMNC